MNLTSEKLYPHYTNREHSDAGVKDRLSQRLKWLRQYLANGTCRRKLIACGCLKEDDDV